MNIGIAVFSYNRSRHLKKVLDGLRKNCGVNKFHLFQDGLKCDKHYDEWIKVRQIIKEIDWCEVVYHQSELNKGVSKSIVDGVNEIFIENDAVIILEDDCVPTANYVSFMTQCFDKYKDDKRVYSVSGYSWPISLPEDKYDIYGCGRNSSWGWGTWKDRWLKYRIDADILRRIKKSQSKSRSLAVWRNDSERMLIDRITGKNDSWSIYWGLCIIENNGICINPYKSLIQNIGMDGSGVHCGVSNRILSELSDGSKTEFALPDHLTILNTTEKAYTDLYGCYTAVNEMTPEKESVIVYGLGNFFKQYEKEINNTYMIKAFIDRWKKGWYAGDEIIQLSEITDYGNTKILVMVADIQDCIEIINGLMNYGVRSENIIMGHSLYGEYSKIIDFISVSPDGKLTLQFGDSVIKVKTKKEFHDACEIFAEQIFNYFINNEKQDIVIDICKDTSVGLSVTYFAGQPTVDKVYDFGLEMNRMSELIDPIINRYSDHNIVLKMDCNDHKSQNKVLEEFLHKGILKRFHLVMLRQYQGDRKNSLYYLKQAGFSWCCSDRNRGKGLIYAYNMQGL